MVRAAAVRLAVALGVAALAASAWAAGTCAKCGMDLSKHVHTRYETVLADGSRVVTCGAQCGLLLEAAKGVQRAWATDFITGRRIDASKAWYVVGSSAVPDMAPGAIAFASREDAERFRRGFGGRVLGWAEAREALKAQMGMPGAMKHGSGMGSMGKKHP